ncbi:MAG: class I SAM-dependent methyltransferase, partial [Candidatus Aureabacteria bacterium]|nr:class I SAM-dependent methyltransferase [Candidatus Auribacterota bacterium]
MHASSDEKFLYELFSNGTDIPGYCRLKRCLVDFEQISAQVHAVLDAGCGGGSKSVYLARNHPALKCHGTDIDENSLRNAEMMKARYRLENASFSQRDLVRCNDLGIFDFVIISDVLEHIDDDAQAARNIDTMLSPGGYLHLNVP